MNLIFTWAAQYCNIYPTGSDTGRGVWARCQFPFGLFIAPRIISENLLYQRFVCVFNFLAPPPPPTSPPMTGFYVRCCHADTRNRLTVAYVSCDIDSQLLRPYLEMSYHQRSPALVRWVDKHKRNDNYNQSRVAVICGAKCYVLDQATYDVTTQYSKSIAPKDSSRFRPCSHSRLSLYGWNIRKLSI